MTLKLSEEEKNYIKLIPIVFIEGEIALRCLFYRCIQSHNKTPKEFLDGCLTEDTIQDLKTNAREKEVLKDAKRREEYEYDITVLLKILKFMRDDEYKDWTGWKREDTDLFEVCIQIKDLRNAIAHEARQSIQTGKFNIYVYQMKDYVRKLGSDSNGICKWESMEFDNCWTYFSKAFLQLIGTVQNEDSQRCNVNIKGMTVTGGSTATYQFGNEAKGIKVEGLTVSERSECHFNFTDTATNRSALNAGMSDKLPITVKDVSAKKEMRKVICAVPPTTHRQSNNAGCEPGSSSMKGKPKKFFRRQSDTDTDMDGSDQPEGPGENHMRGRSKFGLHQQSDTDTDVDGSDQPEGPGENHMGGRSKFGPYRQSDTDTDIDGSNQPEEPGENQKKSSKFFH